MRKKDRSPLVALVLQLAALAFVIMIYLYFRGVATEDRPAPVIPLPAGGPESPNGPGDSSR